MSARERRALERDRDTSSDVPSSSISRERDDGLDDGGGGGGRDRDDDDPSTGASSGLGGSIPGAPSDSGGGGGADQAEQDVMDETARADQEASRRVGGSGGRDDDDDDRRRTRDRDDDDDSRARDDFRNDSRASQRVGGSGDPTDSDTRTDAFEADQGASRRVGGSGDPSDEPEPDTVDVGGAAESGQGPRVGISSESPFRDVSAAAQLDAQTETDIGVDDVVFDDDTASLRRGAQVLERFERQQQLDEQPAQPEERFAFEEDTIQRRIVTGLTEAGEAVSERITPQRLQESPTTARQVGVGPLTAVGFGVSPALEQPDTQEPGELASFGSGAAEVLNVPATAGGLAQGAEFGAVAAQRTAAGEGGEVAQDIEASGRDIAAGLERAATERPVQTGGMLAGSLVGSAGAIRAASGVSGRAGAATRAAIQPGEEIAGIGGARVTRGVAGERAAETLFPQNEPLIFSEEAAIRASRRAADITRRTLSPPADGSVGRVGSGIVPQSRRAETETESQDEPTGLEEELARMEQRGQPQVTPGGRSVRAEVERVRREGGGVPSQRFDPTPQVEFTGFETELETELEPEIETEAALRPEVDLDDLADQQSQLALGIDQEFAVGQLELEEQAVGVSAEADAATEVATEVETATLAETETRLDQETDQRQELELEQRPAEVETETRVPTELETRLDTPQEIEGEPRLPGELEDQQIAADFDSLTGVRAVEATLAPTEFDDA